MIRRAILVLGLSLLVSSAWTQPATAQAPARTLATIKGRVTAADTGRPLRRAQVLVRLATPPAGGRGPIAVTATNSQGQFTIRDVPPGDYHVLASRSGYLELAHGQRRPMEPGQTLSVREGAVLDRIDIALPRASVLAGRITDERGAPYPGVMVEAQRIQYSLGERVPARVATETTDDRGQYRLTDLEPGLYFVAASGTERWVGADGVSYGYAPTYFPGVVPDRAQSIALGSGEQRADVDFSLVADRTARVAGRLVRASGEALAGEVVSLMPRVNGRSGSSVATARTGRDGAFEVRDVPPGNYRVSSAATVDGRSERADVDFTLAGSDRGDILLTRRPGSEMSGVVVVEDGERPVSLSSLRLRYLFPSGSFSELPVGGDGAFRAADLFTPFVLRFANLPEGWMLKRIRQGDADLPEGFIAPSDGKAIAGLELVVTSKSGSLSGDVLDANGQPTTGATIVIFPEDERLWVPGSRFLRTARPGTDGHFVISGLLAGRYRTVAAEFLEEGRGADPEYLKSIRQYSTAFELLDGGQSTVSLRVRR